MEAHDESELLMPPKARNAAKPAPDSFDVNPDGTIDLRVKGQMVYLRCPTVGELEKIVTGHARVLKEMEEIRAVLMEYQTAVLTAELTKAQAAAEPDSPDVGSNEEIEPPMLPDGQEAYELVLKQRRVVSEFWATEILPILSDPRVTIDASDLPGFFGNGESLARALGGWYGLPPVPGGG